MSNCERFLVWSMIAALICAWCLFYITATKEDEIHISLIKTAPTIKPTPTVKPLEINPPKLIPIIPTHPLQLTNRGSITRKLDMRATAYDLSVESCGKKRNHPEYGITRTGTRATVRRTVAVDPNVIRLKSKLYLEFEGKQSFRNGIYFAEDTGNAVKDDIIDIYLGSDAPGEHWIHKAVDKFGVKPVKVTILN